MEISAFTYGPGRAMTYSPSSAAIVSSRSRSRMPLKSKAPPGSDWCRPQKK